MYTVPDDSDRSMAVFHLQFNYSNTNTSYQSDGGQIQLHLPNGWCPDKNHTKNPSADVQPNMRGPYYGDLRGGWIYTVPVPSGTNGWRYSIHCADIPNRPAWQKKAIQFLNQVGFNIRDREYILTSPEITR